MQSRVFCWAPQTAKAKITNGVDFVWTGNCTSEPETAANIVADQLTPRDVVDRGIILSYPVGHVTQDYTDRRDLKYYFTKGHDLDSPNVNFDGYMRLGRLWPEKNSPPLLSTTAWYDRYFKQLKERDCHLDLIASDDEWGITNWQFNSIDLAYFKTVWEDPEVVAARPSYVKFTAAEDLWNGNGDAIHQFNQWCYAIKKKASRQIVSGLYAKHFGYLPTYVSDWGDADSRVAITDPNGWAWVTDRTSRTSSIAAYIGWKRWRNFDWKNFTPNNDPFWAAFITCNNNIRKIASVSDEKDNQALWIPYPRWSDYPDCYPAPWAIQHLQLEVVRHALDLGINRFLYWNPKAAGQSIDNDDLDISRMMAKAPTAKFRNLPQIAPGTTSVTTGAVTTKYEGYALKWKNVK